MNCKLFIVEDKKKLVSCNRCGSVRRSVIYPAEFYFDYLNLFYDVVPTGIQNDMIHKAQLRGQFLQSMLDENPTPTSSILEISSYDGVTLAYLREIFKSEHYGELQYPSLLGIEPTVGAVEFAKQQFPFLKNDLIADLAEQVDYSNLERTFDIVVASYALRMVTDPETLIKNLKSNVRDGGVVLIHEGSLINTIPSLLEEHQNYRQFSQQKIIYPTSHSLKFLFERCGFRFKEMRVHSNAFLQGTMLGFVKTEEVLPQERDLDISKRAAKANIEVWKELNSDEERTKHFLSTVG